MIYNLVKRFLGIGVLIILYFVSSIVGGSPLESGDAYFIKMDYKHAIAVYEQAEGSNAEIQWRIARAYICLSDVSSSEDKKIYVQKAEIAARECIKMNEKISAGHSWLAAAVGNRAMYEGSKAKVHLCNEIKKELDRAIELDPNDDVAFSILGSFYRAIGKVNWVEKTLAKAFLGGLPPGGFAESEQALKEAIVIAPHTIRHWHELGMTYEAWGKKDEAKQAYAKALQLKPQVLSDNDRLQECRKKIKKL